MIVDVRIPSPGESISEVELTRWLVSDGDIVEKDQEIAEVESEKATLPIIAPEAGKIALAVSVGMIKVNEVCCRIDTSFAGKSPKAMPTANSKSQPKVELVEKPKVTTEGKTDFPTHEDKITDKVKVTPLARELMHEYNMNIDDVLNGLRRITAGDVQMVKDTLNNLVVTSDKRNEAPTLVRSEERIRMSQLRKKVSERLVTAKNTTAMLTTFNEVDMSRVQEIRARYQTDFQQKFGVKLGLMSFFVRAAVEALRLHPMTNSMIDGEDIVTPSYIDMGIAVQTPKGLMVPVLRNAQTMSFAEIEKEILRLATKAREGRITLDELNGGTFTITNGGIFGSMLSTPILNYPQSAILGMHNIVDRPVAVNGKVEIRPIMYVALSYDHRIIDGKDSAAFLMDIKRMIENPEKLLFGGDDPIMKLIGL
ncbi:MAG TPA: 2-oxoglutarate dehydrogenase complex dihydrolipoyllysine-residue succinyltransferase [Tenuifilum sp.]|uniref:2-oxoglutarate dehydrogenase complex dihydrolipoyllysine-residue succinyltransferase n=2 Tax=Tenuifilum sp. TaxID=2760880 RepID=UPI001B40CD7C|nr:2-oxoglutarate dehydrogenase complex dihydrolipoyllysine-residue succinyltransferase [Bacteroidales bacterium]HOK85529.1 2-oxoglutarate dehydrogenase complex dihydrolipoyllysine-residue succinyltransferase [Tenuifilum sp.]HRS43092.1 2-oxoglutarate dehydrogenase complex dihydrolipoyllysine-residue succinyltransferase [Tenuifilum sp.]HRU85105.1 2-oxoglutarate dehydrogenase complex dihydrolipoyllysine-residue succinyltransferase [Tenuifilum sp.]